MDPFILVNLWDKKDKEKVSMYLIHKIFIMVIGLKMLCMVLEHMYLNQDNATLVS
jgi:hypothetical protein